MAVASAISRADLVIILCQGSDDDAVEAVKTFKMIGRQGKVLQREIPSVALFTRKSAAITSRKAVKSFGSTLHDLDPKDVGIAGTKKAIAEVHKLTEEVKIRLKQIISKGEG